MLRAEPAVIHRVEHVEAWRDQLHQILVGRDDRHLPTGAERGLRVTGDDVVGFQSVGFDAGHREGAGGLADQRELGDQILGRGRPVRLVLIEHLVAECLGRGVEDHREMARPALPRQILQQLPQHRREAIDGIGGHAVPVGERRQPVIGPEDVARSVDEIEMAGRHRRALASGRGEGDRRCRSGLCLAPGLWPRYHAAG